ncbi:MAG: hypothetical protein DCC75_03965, partial [Proteobacteria bacterium]
MRVYLKLLLVLTVIYWLTVKAVSLVSAENDAGAIEPVRPGITVEEMRQASAGCVDCHHPTDAPSMHKNPGVLIGCAHCHGGDPQVRAQNLEWNSAEWNEAKINAHVQPKQKDIFNTSANPELSYAKLLRDGLFWNSLWITVLFVAGTVLLHLLVGLAVALALNVDIFGSTVWRVIAILPWTIPDVIAG